MPRTTPFERPSLDGPFRKTLDFSGRFIADHVQSKPLHISVEFLEDRAAAIYGRVYGRPDEHLELLPLLGKRNCRLESVGPEKVPGPVERICSSSFHIRQVSGGLHSSAMDLSYVHRCIAEIDFFEIEHTTSLDQDAARDRFICFYLIGPEYYWNLFGIRQLHADGTITYFRYRPRRRVFFDKATGIECSANKFYLFSKQDNNSEVSTYVVTLEFRCRSSSVSPSDSDLLSLCKEHANGLSRLMSFVSRRDVEWFGYWFLAENAVIQSNRWIGYRQEDSRRSDFVDRHTGPIEVKDVYKFLRRSRSKYEKLKDENYDIDQIIALYVAGATSRFVEEQFIALYRALEKFIAEYRSKLKEDGFIASKQWRAISQELRDFVDVKMTKRRGTTGDSIKNGVAGLNRKPVKAVFEEMMTKYKIPWKDVADQRAPLGFIDLRHNVMHKSTETDIARFVRETARLQAIVGRLILWRLGWRHYEQPGWDCRF